MSEFNIQLIFLTFFKLLFSPPSKKRPAIRAPTPEQKHRKRDDDRRSTQPSSDKELAEKVTKIVVEETMEIQGISTNSTPTFSEPSSPRNDCKFNFKIWRKRFEIKRICYLKITYESTICKIFKNVF